MKKIITLSLLVASFAGFAQAADGFATVGNLSSNGWVTHSGTAGQLQVVSTSLSYTGLTSTGNKVQLVAGNGEDVNLASAADLTGTIYYSAVLNLENVTGLSLNTSVTGEYFISPGSTAGGSTGILPARIYIRAGSIANTFNLGILNNSGNPITPTFVATDFPINTTVFVVVKYVIGTNAASLFINPAIGGTEPVLATATNNTGTGTAPTQIRSLCLRQSGTATAGTGNVQVDEVRIGSTWAYVTSATLGIKSNKNNIAGLRVYPNPITNGALYVSTDNNDLEKSIEIYDVLGKKVLSTKTSEDYVNVSNLKVGVYILKIKEEDNIATRKIVIK